MTLAERLITALTASAGPPALAGDDMPHAATSVAAAVLIAITDRAEPGVILTQRTETLRRHAGQVAFPGGRVDPEDTDAVAAALREAHEEIAMPPAAVMVIGTTDRFRTGTGYEIVPVVGVVPADLPLVPAEAEVAAVFEVPLAFLLDPANHRESAGEWQGRTRRFYEIPWPDRRIWGATAGIIVNLSRRLAWQ
ncbi:CoA pyrophosphatase [Sphingomonas sp.]|uniref:CoA pyrophosphatase n=1 Tax=Sphingomonas sp. TaxID=28214 RepID=UPI0035BB9FB2